MAKVRAKGVRSRLLDAAAPSQGSPPHSELVHVSLERANGMWAAAIYLAVLCFPESTEKRHRFIELIKAYFVRETVFSGWARAHNFKPKRQYLRLDPVPSRKGLPTGLIVTASRRLERERLPAASIARGIMVHEGSKSSWFRIKQTIAGKTVTGLGAGALGFAYEAAVQGWLRGSSSDREFDRAENFVNRGWKSSRPVLHLAMALMNVIEDQFPGRLAMTDLIWRPGWVADAISAAEALRSIYLPFFSVLRFHPERAIRLESDKNLNLPPKT